MNKEHFKTILIVSLFIVSLILTQQLWIVLPIGDSVSTSGNKVDNVNIDVADILSPQSFVINFGGGNHTVFFAEPYEIWNITKSEEKESIWIWKNVRKNLSNYFNQDIQLEIITEEEWININKFKSLRLNFASEIPSSSIIKVLSNEKKIVDNNMEDINSLLIPANEAEKNNIYFANPENKFYIKIKGTNNSNETMIDLVNSIAEKGQEKGYISYYPLKDYISVNSNLLTPIFQDSRIPLIKTMNEVDVTDKTLVRSLANKFFGESLDFVKEIKETNGTIIYMYGYGEKALKINPDGLLEHIEQPTKEKISNNLNYVESLKIAGKFVKEYIGWPINSENAYLSYYQVVGKDNNKGYRFGFNYRLKGLPVIIPNIGQSGAIEVEVIGNQVTYYKRIIKKIEEEKAVDKEIPFIIDILDKNLQTLRIDYIKNTGEEEIENTTLLEYIDSIELAYFYDENENTLLPSWKIELKDMIYYFDLYEGNIIHSYKN